MGEVVVNGGDGTELDVHETQVDKGFAEQKIKKKCVTESGGNAAAAADISSVVSWERFLPKTAMRILLVEADDSTRQIIAALLRKCSYKVAAVSDGLKAWEILTGKSHNIDLILTEVELPSISGYALLTLIMEHHVYKNIPIIMMSSHDSVSMVYKCMLRGAADFLVKPVRKNELRNLWQHVWRKQVISNSSGKGPPDGNLSQQEVEASAENNTLSDDHTSEYMASIKSNRKCIEKENDAQSSCTKPDFESENACVLLQSSNAKLTSHDENIHAKEAVHRENRQIQPHDNKTSECGAEPKNSTDYIITLRQDKDSENNGMRESSCREAIDLIGALENCRKGNNGSCASNGSENKSDVSPVLDLSLRRCHLSGSMNQTNDETQRLNHSHASAFSRYKNMPPQSSISRSPSTCNQQKDQETTNSEKQQSSHMVECTSDKHAPSITSQRAVSVANISSAHPEITFSYPTQTSITHPIPLTGAGFVIDSYDSATPAIYSTPSRLSPLPTLSSFYPSEYQPTISKTVHDRMDHTAERENIQKSENLDDHRGNLRFCYDTWSGNNKNKVNIVSVLKGASECGNEEVFHVYEGMSHRSLQREAALTKFRLKRKERCFEKKVRYESRKKLAEQRPRVKGQFVRQVPNEV